MGKVKKKRKYPAEKKCICPECGMKFYFMCKLKSHLLVHTGEKPYLCEYCDKSFNSQYSLKTHKYIHTDEKPFECSFCDYSCRDTSTLRKHQYRHMGIVNEYKCKICYKAYTQKCRLKAHVAEKHMQMKLATVSCELCGNSFKSKTTLKVHIDNVHHRANTCKCPICNVTILNKSNLAAHLRTHVDERPYMCPYPGCKKRYKDSSGLQRHTILHEPDKQFPCDKCGRLFTRKHRLNRHVLTVHNKKKKTVECDYCGVKFLSKNYLIKHINQKHCKKRKKYKCDMCKFKTFNKPSIVMHIKYGHGNEKDLECNVCHIIFKQHVYLKLHYERKHNIVYKTKKRPPPMPIKIKEEPKEVEEVVTVEGDIPPALEFSYEVVKQEPAERDSNADTGGHSETPDDILERSYSNLKSIPEDVFDRFYIDHIRRISLRDKDTIKHSGLKIRIDTESRDRAMEFVQEQLDRVRGRDTTDAVEEKGQPYNLREKSGIEKETTKVKMFENNKRLKKEANNNNDNKEGTDQNDNTSEENALEENSGDEVVGEEKQAKKSKKVNFNLHQCYTCFKLFKTKDELIEHCKEHFDVCFRKSLKKCPLCDYASTTYLPKHIKRVHNIKIRMPYRIYDKEEDGTGCKYYLKVNNPKIPRIEIIPSIKNLNKLAMMKIDRINREEKIKTMVKNKLVRKGKEWIVQKEKIQYDEALMPKFDTEELKKIKEGDSESYFKTLRKLYQDAKKEGRQLLFPCQNCEKICQNFSALKLHHRKHDPNAKPFKPKFWKHKHQGEQGQTPTPKPLPTENRLAKPKPVQHNHQCDYELKEFYENNIRGGDIEFWQFLKIFNKMGRDKINDFKDLKGNYEYGMDHHSKYGLNDEINYVNTNGDETGTKISEQSTKATRKSTRKTKKPKKIQSTDSEYDPSDVDIPKETNNVKTRLKTVSNSKVKRIYKRLGLSREQYANRLLAKNKLRENIAKGKVL